MRHRILGLGVDAYLAEERVGDSPLRGGVRGGLVPLEELAHVVVVELDLAGNVELCAGHCREAVRRLELSEAC